MTLFSRSKHLCFLDKLSAARGIEYLVVDQNFCILDVSHRLRRFANAPQSVEIGADVRLSFPELRGVEDQLRAVLGRQRDCFELVGIERSRHSHPFYINLQILENQEDSDFKDQWIIWLRNLRSTFSKNGRSKRRSPPLLCKLPRQNSEHYSLL
ncbi:MAG: hypothetical protein HC780_14035 [Leptolyngbyaceae cyanobacterium CSU_1_3]|nr:hypothetical protein [Leptolyngbyaceae cyanobacterium CSU_1_3]